MTDEIKKIFSDLISERNWHKNTSLNRAQASAIKKRFEKGELSLGRILEVLIECGHTITVSK